MGKLIQLNTGGGSPEELLAQGQVGTNLEVASVMEDAEGNDRDDVNDGRLVSVKSRKGLHVVENVEKQTSDMTLADFMADMEGKSEKDKSVAARLRKLQMILLFVSMKAKVSPDQLKNQIYLRSLPGNQIGEADAENRIAMIDPVLLNKKSLEILRHVLLHEYVMHIVNGLDENAEALAELGAARMTGENAIDYIDLVKNMETVVDTLGDGNKEDGFNRAVELCKDQKYQELYDEFEAACKRNCAKEMAIDPDFAFKTFQAAFPNLHNINGEFETDIESIEEESRMATGKALEGTSDEEADDTDDGSVNGGYVLSA